MILKFETIPYYIEDALVEIEKIAEASRSQRLTESELFPWLEHGLEMANCAYNSRNFFKNQMIKMSDEKWERLLLPPIDMFGSNIKKNEKERQ